MDVYRIRKVLRPLIVLACLAVLAIGNAAAGTIIDNKDADFYTSGSWPSSKAVTGYYGSDYQYSSNGNGSSTATWKFVDIPATGSYDVEAQWSSNSSRATDAHYTLYQSVGSQWQAIATVTKNQQIGGNQFNLLGTYNLAAGTTLKVVLDNNASGYVIADAVQVTYKGEASGNLPPEGTINTPANDITITVGDFIDFTGTYLDPDGDTAQGYLWEFGAGSGLADSIAEDPGPMQFNNTGVFTVRFTVTDSNGEPDPAPAQVTVTVVPPGGSTLIDNTDAGFWTSGSWPSSTGVAGYDGSNYQYSRNGNGSNTATWRFAITTSGYYDVEAQWTSNSSRANDAHYTLYNNGSFVANVTKNQQSNGGKFNLLGSYNVSAGTLDVVLDNNASGYVIADAVQVTYKGEATGNLPPDGTIKINNQPAADLTITVGDFIDFTGTYSDPNADPAQGYLWEFGAGSGLANSGVKDPGAKQFNNAGVFTVKFTVTDSKGESDPTPAQVNVTVKAQGGSSNIIDNTDSGFSTSGNWPSSKGVTGYYGSNYQYSSKGDGSATASWRFDIPSTGSYDVEAQWTTNSSRATDAHYTLYKSVGNQWQVIAIVTKNQQSDGGKFNSLGSYNLEGGTSLKVVLDNNASGYVIADAIRVTESGSPPQPQLVITSPTNNPLVSSTYMTVNALVSNLPAGWGVEFVLNDDDPATPATSFIDNNAPFEHTFLSLDKAQYGVDVYVVDDTPAHNRQPGLSEHTDFGVGDYLIAFGDSITRGGPSHDDITSDNTSNDGRNTGGGFEPILNNRLTAKSGYPQTVINAGVSGDTTSTALSRLSGVLSDNPEATHVLILLGTNDAYWDGLDANIYKDHMQQIITTVVTSGKIPVLAKVLIVQPFNDSANLLIQQYNTAIDQLADSNGITLARPDFYTYFESHPELFDDNLHPNGSGFISMANLWSNIFTY